MRLTNVFSKSSVTRIFLMVAFLVLWVGTQVATAATPLDGIDCNSTKTGFFVDPAVPEITGAGFQAATSPHSVYQVETQYGSGAYPPITLTIKKGTASVLTLTVPYTSAWGFSPDDDRFVQHDLNGTYHTVNLYDLTKSGTSKLVRTFTGDVGSALVAFSPHGQHFQYARLTGGLNPATYLTIVDARTGTIEYETNFQAVPPPPGTNGPDSVDIASWGYSPDPIDRTFVYSYVSGVNTAQLETINLNAASQAERIVHEETMINATAAFWKFSPSGDVLGVVVQPNQTAMTISLYRTAYQQQLVSQGFTPVGAVDLKTTLDWHLVNINNTGDQQLAPNSADAPCSVSGTTELSNLTVASSTVTSGGSTTGTVTLTAAAPTGGTAVALSSSNPAAATVPASVAVASGQTSATFTITAGTVRSDTPATITASLGTVTKTASITVSPAPVTISSFTLYDTRIMGGASTYGHIQLSGPAPDTGVTIQFSSDNPAVQPAASLFLASGNTSGDINVNSSAVAADTTATITARLGTSTKTATLTLLAAPPVASFTIAPNSVLGGANNPYPIGTITLSAPAPLNIDLVISNSNSSVAHSPWSVRIYEGQTTGTFQISTYPVSTVSVVTFSVDSGVGGSKTASLTVTPPGLGALTIPGGRVPGGRTITGTVTMNPEAPAGGAVISLQSDNSAAVVPATVTVPARLDQATFTIQTSAVTQHTAVTITASYAGTTKTATLKVLAPASYSVVDVGTLGGPEVAVLGINALGNAIGISDIDNYGGQGMHRGFVWTGCTPTRLEGMTGATAINNQGLIVGNWNPNPGTVPDPSQTRAVLYRDGNFVTIGPSAGYVGTQASDINDTGQVVGYTYTSNTSSGNGFLWQDGATTILPGLSGGASTASAINRLGMVAGSSNGRAVLWNNGTPQDLGVPAGRTHTGAQDLNDSGTVVGMVDSWDANGHVEFFHAARWENGVWTDLGTLGGKNSTARAINNSGQIVGSAEIDPNQLTLDNMTLWTKNGALIDLNDEVPFDEGWWLQEAYGINDAGQIVGVAKKGHYPGPYYGVILTPVVGPAPTTADLCVTMSHTPEPVALGGNLTYTLTLVNKGPVDATSVVLTDTLPSGVTFVSTSATTGTASESGGKVTWSISPLAYGDRATLTIVVTPTVGGTITNSASVTAYQSDPNTADNAASDTATVLAGDTVAPTTVASPSHLPGASGWNGGDVTVTLSASDNAGGSGVDKTEYSLDGGSTWTTYTAPFQVSTEGENTIQYRSTDKAGNVETAKSITIKIDKTAPTGSILINDGAASTNTPNVTLTVTANDGGSGVSKMRLSDTDSGLGSAPWGDFAASKPYTLAGPDGTKTVFVQFQDGAGKVSISYSDDIVLRTATVPLDTTATLSPQPNSSGWNNADVTVTLTATDNAGGSGIDKTEYSQDGGTTWTTYTVPFTVSNEGTNSLQYRSKDKAGNIETAKSLTIKIDKSVPTGSISINDGAASTNNASVTLTLTANDGGSGVSKMRLSDTSDGLGSAPWEDFVTSKAYTLPAGDGTKTVFVQFQDGAGNLSTSYSDDIVMTTANQDTTKPTISAAVSGGTLGTNGWYTSNVTVHFTCADTGGSGIPTGACPADQILSSEGASVSSTAQTVTDAAGNVSDPSNVITVKIDKTKPTISAAVLVVNAVGPSSCTVSSTAAVSDWCTSNVTVRFTCSDTGGSGIPTGACPADQILSTEGSSVSSSAQTVTDAAGNKSEASNVITVKIDKTAPTVAITDPKAGDAVQDGYTFAASLSDSLSGPESLNFSIRSDDGSAAGKPVGFEKMPATKVSASSGQASFSLKFETAQLTDGYYLLIAQGYDMAGNFASTTIHFKIVNLAVVNLTPATDSNNAGRTMPVKVGLRDRQANKFVENQELTIKIHEKGSTTILQSSTYGAKTTDYRIDKLAELYITNFQTSKTPTTYVVELWRETATSPLLVGSYEFKTVK